MPGFSPTVPLKIDLKDGFSLTQTYYEVAKQNLKTLILTNPGERIMDRSFGVGIKKQLFEQNTEVTKDRITSSIREQVSRYLPYINIDNIIYNENLGPNPDQDVFNSLSVRIIYSVGALNISDDLQILVSI